jgi:4-hydroxy-tetrahydrodipicolinate synthase
LNPDEHSRVLRLAVKRSRVPVVAGVGAATLDLSLDLARHARESGAEALLLPPPFFYPYRPDEVREFYLQFRDQMPGIPIFLEHLPEFTTGIDLGIARELLMGGRFAGIVDTTGDHAAAGLNAILAKERWLARARCSGAAVLSAAACAVPELVLALDAALGRADSGEASRLDLRLQELLDWFERFPAFALLRVATGLRGIKTGPLAVPLSAEKEKLMGQFKEWFKSWL